MPRPRLCSLDVCDQPSHARGWCSSHYNRWHKTGDVQADRPLGPYHGTRRCEIDGCDEPHKARGMCDRHYTRSRTGKPLA